MMLHGRRPGCEALDRLLEAAAGRFEEALRLHQGQGRPFDPARTELVYGEALRRARRRGEARAHLRGAQLFLSRRAIDYHLRNVFVKLGSPPGPS